VGEQRCFDRVTFRDPLVLAGTTNVLAEARDISANGVFASAQRVAFEPGARVVVHLHPRGELGVIRLPGIVRRVRSDGVGIQFGALGVREAHVLMRIVAAARVRTRSRLTG
jgi:hypothetical protein